MLVQIQDSTISGVGSKVTEPVADEVAVPAKTPNPLALELALRRMDKRCRAGDLNWNDPTYVALRNAK